MYKAKCYEIRLYSFVLHQGSQNWDTSFLYLEITNCVFLECDFVSDLDITVLHVVLIGRHDLEMWVVVADADVITHV